MISSLIVGDKLLKCFVTFLAVAIDVLKVGWGESNGDYALALYKAIKSCFCDNVLMF